MPPVDSSLGYMEKHGAYVDVPVQNELIPALISVSLIVHKQLENTISEPAPVADFIDTQIMTAIDPVLSQMVYGS
jgi:hypothetical protein